MVGILREHDEVARAVRSQYRHFVVDEYQDVNRLQQTLLELWLGERRRPLRRRRPGPDHLLVHRGLARAPARLPHPPPRRPAPSSWCATTARRRRSCRPGQPRAARSRRAAPLRRRSSCGRSGRTGPAPELARRRQRPRRGGHRRHPHRRAGRRRAPALRGRRAVPHQRPERVLRDRAGRARHPLPRARRRAVLLPQGGPRRHRPDARRRPVRRRLGARCPTSSATCCSAPAGRRAGADERRRRPRALGVAVALAALADDLRALDPEARMPALVRRARGARLGAARPDRAGRHAGVAARGQGPGVGRRVPRRLLRRPAADHHGRHPRGGRGGAPAALRRGHPRPRAARPVVRRRPRTPGAQGHPAAVAVPRRHRRRAR